MFDLEKEIKQWLKAFRKHRACGDARVYRCYSRKILGAGMGSLVNLLSAEVVKLIVIAALVAWPLAYLGARYWLQNFVDQIEIKPWLYLSATGVVALICGLAVSFQVVRAAGENPVHSLRQE